MSTMVRVTFEIEKDRAETIVGLLIKDVKNFHVEEVPRRNGRSSAHEDRKKWASRYALALLQHMKQKPSGTEFFYKDLGSVIKPLGLKETSITSLLTELIRGSKVRRTRRGYYALT